MKIIYKKADLFKCEERIIMHGVNAQNRMGAGVAKLIKQKYPQAYLEYKTFCNIHRGAFMGGHNIIVDCEDKLIINAMTQQYYGREPKKYVSYVAVRLAMSNLNTDFIYNNKNIQKWGNVVAMPKIGAGLAGGDWKVIEQIIEEESTDFQPVVYYL